MYQPQILDLDPQRIKFNKHNPRKHGGEEYEHLKQSIQEIGIIQPPLVRHLTGIFYEVIDGEGRVSVAQDLALPSIKVMNLGEISEEKALELLVTSNMVRTFDFFAQCRGMAEMHRRGMTVEEVGRKVGISYPGNATYYIGIGYLPNSIIDNITDVMLSSEKMVEIWANKHLIRSLLPLRQVRPGESERPGKNSHQPLDDVYDYTEVRQAVQLVNEGKITNGLEMRAYVANRKLEIAEERFKDELEKRLQDELTRAEKALEEAKELDISKAKEETQQVYQSQMDVLGAQLTTLQEERDKALASKALSEKDKEVIKSLTHRLNARSEELKEVKRKAREEAREQARKEQEAELKALKANLEAEAKARKEVMEKEEAESKEREKQAKKDLEIYRKDLDAKYKLKAETSYRQLVANVSERLSQSRQSVLHVISEEMIQGIEWLSQAELFELRSHLRAARDTLDEAERSIEQRIGIVSSDHIVDSGQPFERSLMNHHG